jgi:hypothetical protein
VRGEEEKSSSTRNSPLKTQRSNMRSNEYPSAAELLKVTQWKFTDRASLDAFLEYIRGLWFYPDRFVLTRRSLYLSTGGWSGNDRVIAAMQKHPTFWLLWWKKSKRGGHYWFDRIGAVRSLPR